MFSLKDKHAVITGGGSGIGKAISKLFARQGAVVHIIDLNAQMANDTLEEIKQEGFEAHFYSADVTNQTVQYLYSDGNTFYFMNEDTFEQFEIDADLVGDGAGYLKEGDKVTLQFFDGRAINVELPKNVPLEVTYTEHAVKGDTSSSITKDATLETGITIRVPAFIKTGDIISVDTSNGAYRERVKQ